MEAASFPEENRASALLAKISNGVADADFARAIGICLDASRITGKKSKVVLTIEIDPREDLGSVEMRADVTARPPKTKSPVSQMHIGPNGELLTQLDFMMGGGRDEKPAPITAKIEGPKALTSSSGRMPAALPVVAGPAPAPIAAGPKPAPLAE